MDNALGEYKNALELNPNNVMAHLKMGFIYYYGKGMAKEGIAHLSEAIRISPKDPRIHYDLGMALVQEGEYDQAIKHLSVALERIPSALYKEYDPADMRRGLGTALFHTGKFRESASHLAEAVRLNPNDARSHYILAILFAIQGKTDQTVKHYTEAVRIAPSIDRSRTLHDLLGMNYAKVGQFQKAILSAQKALELARAAGEEDQAREIEARIELYKQNKPYER